MSAQTAHGRRSWWLRFCTPRTLGSNKQIRKQSAKTRTRRSETHTVSHASTHAPTAPGTARRRGRPGAHYTVHLVTTGLHENHRSAGGTRGKPVGHTTRQGERPTTSTTTAGPHTTDCATLHKSLATATRRQQPTPYVVRRHNCLAPLPQRLFPRIERAVARRWMARSFKHLSSLAALPPTDLARPRTCRFRRCRQGRRAASRYRCTRGVAADSPLCCRGT
jgi:hypothetical protein